MAKNQPIKRLKIAEQINIVCLFAVIIPFYISGIVIRVILNKAFSDDKKKDKESQDTESSQDDSPSEDGSEKADNQSEKNEQK